MFCIPWDGKTLAYKNGISMCREEMAPFRYFPFNESLSGTNTMKVKGSIGNAHPVNILKVRWKALLERQGFRNRSVSGEASTSQASVSREKCPWTPPSDCHSHFTSNDKRGRPLTKRWCYPFFLHFSICKMKGWTKCVSSPFSYFFYDYDFLIMSVSHAFPWWV